MKDILLIFFLIDIKSSLYDKKDIFQTLIPDENIKIKPGVSKTLPIKYFQKTILSFINEIDNAGVQVNIHSINCDIQVEPHFYKSNFNIYSIIINNTNENITIEPELDKIGGEYKENYERKSCYLSINSYFLNDTLQNLTIENNEENIFYLNKLNYNIKNIVYEIKNISLDSFISLNLQFKESTFSLYISFYIDNIQINSLNKTINESTNVYLDSTFLLYKNRTSKNIGKSGFIYINIINYNNVYNIYNILHFKIIEKDTICLLEKNALNFGFSTTKTTYRYYYAEVFQNEEGELILHNKRFYGELYGKIIIKDEINKQLLNNSSIYPNSFSKGNLLEYNQNYLKLKYDYINTFHCFNGCYLLITYKRLPFKGDFPSVGYEFTILSRTWNYTDYISPIIDIPYNEFIIGCFDKDSIQTHYYSIDIPLNAEKIIIELDSNYLESFFSDGRKRINTQKSNKTGLNIINNKGVDCIYIDYKEELKFISFALKPFNYDSNKFSFYYFKILYIKKSESIYYTIDSYLGNLCIPEYNNDNKNYYCNFKLNNNFKESDLKFIISSTNQNEYFKIYITKVYNDGTTSIENSEYFYVNNEMNINIDYYEFKFEFSNQELKNIIISFLDTVEDVYPQIYSPQMYFIDKFTKINYFNIKNKYSLHYQYIYGDNGLVDFPGFNLGINFNKNLKGINFIYDGNGNITIIEAIGEFSYLYQLIHNDKANVIEEIYIGEPTNKIVKGIQFPFYFYIKLEKYKDINVIVNLALRDEFNPELEKNIVINGYLLNEKDIIRFLNDEYIQLKNPIEGYYSNVFDIGFIQIIREYNENYNYLLIEIQNKVNKPKLNSDLLIDVFAREYTDNDFSLPLNTFIFETFNGTNNAIRDENRYCININQIGSRGVLIELSPQYDDIVIKFDNIKNFTVENSSGFKKYRIWNTNIYNIYFSVINPKNRTANYMIRYYYIDYLEVHEFYFDEKFERKEISLNDKIFSISLTFNSMKIKSRENEDEGIISYGIYFLITGTLYITNRTSNENVNSTSKLIEHIPILTNITYHYYNGTHPENWSLIYENIPRDDNYIYDLQLQIKVKSSYIFLYEEFLIYKTSVDLTDLKLNNSQKLDIIIIILTGIIGGFIVIIAIFFIIKFIKLKKINLNLDKEIKSLAYSNDIRKNVLIKEEKKSEKDSDYESTFI